MFTPDEDGDWEIGLNIAGRGNLFIDDKLVIELSINPPQGDSFFGLGTADVRKVLHGLKAGQKHSIEIRLSNKEFIARGAPFSTRGGIRLGAMRQIDPEEGIKTAVQVAKEADRRCLNQVH
jgi:beta-glucosidase